MKIDKINYIVKKVVRIQVKIGIIMDIKKR